MDRKRQLLRASLLMRRDRNGSQVLIYSKYPRSHPFHKSLSRATKDRLVSERQFNSVLVRHRFVAVTFCIVFAISCLPAAAMALALGFGELREVCERYMVDLALFLALSLLFGAMHFRDNFKRRPRLAALLLSAFVAVHSLHMGSLYYTGRTVLYKTVLLLQFQALVMYATAILFCLQCYMDIFVGRVSHLCLLALLVSLNLFLIIPLVLGLRWLPAVNVLYSSAGYFYLVVFVCYYSGTFVGGLHSVRPDSYWYAAAKYISYLLLYQSIIAQAFKLDLAVNYHRGNGSSAM